MVRRLLPLVASVALALLALAGCGSAPSQVDAAAVVGQRVIPIELLQERLRTAAPDLQAAYAQQAAEQGAPAGTPVPSALLADQSRRLLTVSVLHELVAEQSRRDGITVTPVQVDALLAGSGGAEVAARGSGFAPATVRELVADQIAVAEIGRRAFDRIAVTVDYATLADRARAEELARRVTADPARAGALFASVPGGAAGQVLRPGSASRPGGPVSATSIVYGVPTGTVAVAPGAPDEAGSGSAGGRPWTVVRVTDRMLSAPPATTGIPAATVDEETAIAFGLRLLQPLALDLGVRVSPRYGAWDPTQLAVVESALQTGTIQPAGLPAVP